MIRAIHSGGQTGADQGGLFAGRAAGIETGGWAPKGWRTEGAPAPWLADWGLKEHSGGYLERTDANVADTDGTLLIGDPESSGSQATLVACERHGKPYLIIRWKPGGTVVPREQSAAAILAWTERSNIGVLNVAGNRESRAIGIQAATFGLVLGVLKLDARR